MVSETYSSLREVLYGKYSEDLENYRLDDLPDIGSRIGGGDDKLEVVAVVTSRADPMYSSGVCTVLGSYSCEGIPEQVDGYETMTLDEIVDEFLPQKPTERYAIPSIRGEYLDVKHRSQYQLIPIEFVIKI